MDRSYRYDNPDAPLRAADRIFEKLEIDWTNVFVPDGWDEVLRTFNVSGYGIILVDPQGIVRGVDIRAKDLPELLKRTGA